MTRARARERIARASLRWAPLALALTVTVPGTRMALAQEQAGEAPAGKDVYDRWCAGCHGVDGAGDGPAAVTMLPRPRDFTRALYEIRTTPSGELPTDADILRMIDEGMPGTAMPGWRGVLSESERRQLVDVLKSFSRFFESGDAPEPIEIGDPPGVDDEGLAEGRELYQRMECWKCHGEQGRGDGPSAPTLEDDLGYPVRAADLTENWLFNGGGSTEAIFTRLMTGLNGTPMPSYADMIDAEVATEEQMWGLAAYVRSLAPEKPPVAREVIRAELVEGDLPVGVDDERWAEVERFYVPLVGQVIVEPRWFAPRVDGVWVQALHDGDELVLRLVWHDPSRSPDPDWAEWRERIPPVMAPPVEGAAGEPTGAEPETDAVGMTGAGEAPIERDIAPEAGALDAAGDAPADTTAVDAPPPAGDGPPDQLVVQFPTTVPEGMKRPYFLLGSEDDPVYLWQWTSESDSVMEALGHGIDSIEALSGVAGGPSAEATFDHGEWRVVIRRPIPAGEVENRLGFDTGRPIPIALFVWDGDNAEEQTQGAIGTWYFLWLDEPTESTVYAIPIAAMLLTAGLGIVFVRRARRGADGNDHADHQPEEDDHA